MYTNCRQSIRFQWLDLDKLEVQKRGAPGLSACDIVSLLINMDLRRDVKWKSRRVDPHLLRLLVSEVGERIHALRPLPVDVFPELGGWRHGEAPCKREILMKFLFLRMHKLPKFYPKGCVIFTLKRIYLFK